MNITVKRLLISSLIGASLILRVEFVYAGPTVAFNGHSYQGFDQASIITYEDASAICKGNGGYLAVVTSQSENDFVYTNFGIDKSGVNKNIWLGATEDTANNWHWINGEPWSYTNWAAGQPDGSGGGSQYLLMWAGHNGQWGDSPNGANCGFPGVPSFVCESDSASISTASNCLFNWAETNYAGLFSPADAATQTLPPYTYRYYKNTNAYVGVSSANNDVYYLGPDGNLVDVGNLSGWLTVAKCQ
jgi:hypothetical protein